MPFDVAIALIVFTGVLTIAIYHRLTTNVGDAKNQIDY